MQYALIVVEIKTAPDFVGASFQYAGSLAGCDATMRNVLGGMPDNFTMLLVPLDDATARWPIAWQTYQDWQRELDDQFGPADKE